MSLERSNTARALPLLAALAMAGCSGDREAQDTDVVESLVFSFAAQVSDALEATASRQANGVCAPTTETDGIFKADCLGSNLKVMRQSPVSDIEERITIWADMLDSGDPTGIRRDKLEVYVPGRTANSFRYKKNMGNFESSQEVVCDINKYPEGREVACSLKSFNGEQTSTSMTSHPRGKMQSFVDSVRMAVRNFIGK